MGTGCMASCGLQPNPEIVSMVAVCGIKCVAARKKITRINTEGKDGKAAWKY